MRHYSYLLISLFVLISITIAATKTTVKFGSHEKQFEDKYTLQNRLIDRHNLAVDDIDTLMTHVTTIETATVGVNADTLYKTAVKAARLRGDSVISAGSQFTRLRGDSIVTTAIKTTRVRSDSSVITATLITRLRADSCLITAIKGTRGYIALTNYADSTAARAAGIVNGQLYHVDGTVKIMY